MKLILLAALATLAVCQIFPNRLQFATAFGYVFEYDRQHDLVLVVSSTDCDLIDAPDDPWDDLIGDRQQAQQVAEDIYDAIRRDAGITTMSQQEAEEQYHSRIEEFQCRRDHDIHKLAFTPSTN